MKCDESSSEFSSTHTAPVQPGLLSDSLAASAVRLGVYTVVLMTFFFLLPKLVATGGVTIFKEHGVIEWLQIKLLVTAMAIFLLAARAFMEYRQMMILLGAVCLYAVIRELDATLDNLIPVIGWKFGLVLGPAAIWYCCRHRVALERQATRLITMRSIGMLWVAFVVAVPFGQLVGNGNFLRMIMGDQYDREYKRVIEELCELTGYVLILIGSIELSVQLRSLQRAQASARDRSSQAPSPRDPLMGKLHHAASDSAN